VTEEKKRKIAEEEDFIDYPKFKNSLKNLIDKYPNGVENDVIAKVLMLKQEEVEKIYQKSIEKIKKTLKL